MIVGFDLLQLYFVSYEEGEVEQINDILPNLQFVGCNNYKIWTKDNLSMYKGCPINTQPRGHTSTFESIPMMKWVGEIIDMLDFTFVM